MKVKIWGARGSVPAPLGPEAVREKIISAIAGIAKIDDGALREELISAILTDPDHPADTSGQPASSGMYEKVNQKIRAKRRQVIENYVDNISPLGGSTAGGNTPCIEIRAGNDLFIIDAGSGIRELGLELMKGPCGRGEGVIHLLFSHPHWDHIQGFPFFRPAFIPGNQIYIYSVHNMESALRRQQEFISFPVSLDYMQASMIFKQFQPGEVLQFGDLRIRNIRNEHPGDAYGYRFEKGDKVFVYASDSAYPEGIDLRPHLNFFGEADVLIFDAQFTQRESDEKEDWGHSSSFVGVEMAQETGVKNLVLFHYDPTYSDHDLEKILEDTLKFQQNQYPNKTPVNVMIAQEGQTFDLTPSHTTEVQQIPGSQAAILKPTGVFDEHVASELKEQLTEMAQTGLPPQLIIDMSAVEMLQVAGLRALVKLRKEHQGEGASMALVGPSNNVRQLIELAGYLDFFAIYDSVHTALNALQSRETLNLPGQILKNRYRIESKIGEGRLGTVFKATDTQQNLPVAIKILSPSFSEGAIERFLGQAREIIELAHPNVVRVYDCDEDRGISFMAEEFIEGTTLQDMIDKNPGRLLPFDVALSIAGSITRALEYTHAHGVIHGDLKPKNVLLSDELKVSDFGLGRLESGKPLVNIDVPLALVTAQYLAPEQVLGQPIDARTDLYALGVILYELFTGQPPFTGSDQEVIEQHRSQPPTPPRELNPALSRSLEHLILKLLDKDPTKRYARARQVSYILSSMSGAISGEVHGRTFAIERWPALVGREEVLQRLSQLWLETEQGRGQAVFIHGPSGVGKTRLAQELTYRLNEATVLIGECEKLEKSAAYAPFISALKTYFSAVPPEVAGENVGRVWQEMAQLIPEISNIIPKVPSASTNGKPAAPTSLAQSIGRIAAKRPWLLILDNLQWIDQSSLKLLDYLALRCKQMPLMIVALYEDGDLEENEFLPDTLEAISRQTNCTVLSPEPLTEEEMRVLLESIWSQAVPADLVTTIHNLTKGNPLYAKEVAKGLVEEGVVNRQDDKWHFDAVTESKLPKQIERAIRGRVKLLSRETQTFLNQAAVMGSAIKFADLYEMSDLSEWDALESLDIALQRQLLKEVPGEKMVRFRHGKIQDTLYKGLSSLKQQLLHREAGEALERQYLPNPGEIVEALAYHFLQAGELEKGLIYSIRAATQAHAIYAVQNAMYWYTTALDTMDQLGLDNVTQEQRFELLLAREQIYNLQGMRQVQAADLAALQSLAQTLNDPAKQAQVHNRQSAYEYTMGRLAEAATEAQAGLIAARQADNSTLEGESLIRLAYIALHQGQLDSAREHLQTAQNILKDTDNRSAEAESLQVLGTIYKFLNDYPISENYYQQALTMNQLAANRRSQAACLSNLGDLLLKKGDYTAAKSYQEQALVLNQTIGYRQGEAICLNRLGAIYKELGYYDTALAYIEQDMSLHRTLEDEQGLAGDLHMLGAIHRATGYYATARDHAGQALEIFQRTKNKLQEGNIWLEVALALEGMEDYAKASHAYNQVQNILTETGHKTGSFDARAGLARCLLAEGKTDSAQQKVTALLEEAGQNGEREVRYPILLYLTAYRVLQAANNPDEALEALHQGHTLLQNRANNIGDSRLQASFLENVPENKELLTQLEQHQIKETAN